MLNSRPYPVSYLLMLTFASKGAEHVSSCEQGYVSAKAAYWILGNSPYHRLQTEQK